ncbi:MAG: Gfo/Idh/MocA family oxidoreductase [Paludisphaera borealis]|uniref:Gfo/Idh/MocA family oxidoreductase n=1 Tax=Paludisphaera borealis TaxID=1387353 RepID=UPI002846B3A5|nr:Gfo/Idh/MocA family oxidoreductase [Paludisphaera borealis]MDR3622547.1 Gfo/Idh/MocA family oxidoreductase [Paludisphaera borealis]
MKILIIGDGDDERVWAEWAIEQDDLDVIAVQPGFAGGSLFDGCAIADLDEALATPGLDAAIVGGPIEQRAEALRRAAAEGLATLCLHPPGLDSEAYYQVAMSRHETGAVVVPDLPLRLHPGVGRLREAIAAGTLGAFRAIRHESPAEADESLVRVAFARAVDVVRALLGEVEALTANGDPPGVNPEHELVVQLRAEAGRRAEIRLSSEPGETARVMVVGSNGSVTLEYDPYFESPARLIQRASTRDVEQTTDLGFWDSHAAVFDVLRASRALAPDADVRLAPSPSLHDGTRSMELTEAVVRSLRRGRTIDLHYERISEAASFKSIMTSTGCMLLLGSLFVLPLALAGPALGFNWTIYIAYLILPILILFTAVQLLRFGIKPEPTHDDGDDLDQPSPSK